MRRLTFVCLVALSSIRCAHGQETNKLDQVQKGHELAAMVCSVCHLAAADQPSKPILKPPAPPFVAIMRRNDIDANALRGFMTTTHRGLDNPKGMPNPLLMDYQLDQVIAYMLSLRN